MWILLSSVWSLSHRCFDQKESLVMTWAVPSSLHTVHQIITEYWVHQIHYDCQVNTTFRSAIICSTFACVYVCVCVCDTPASEATEQLTAFFMFSFCYFTETEIRDINLSRRLSLTMLLQRSGVGVSSVLDLLSVSKTVSRLSCWLWTVSSLSLLAVDQVGFLTSQCQGIAWLIMAENTPDAQDEVTGLRWWARCSSNVKNLNDWSGGVKRREHEKKNTENC